MSTNADLIDPAVVALDTDNNPLAFYQLVQLMVDSYQAARAADNKVTDFVDGSITLAIFEAVAAPLEELNYQMAVVLPAKFYLDQAGGATLDRLVSNFTFGQVTRVPASTGAGSIVFTGADGTTIADGTVFSTPTGLLVKTIGTVQIAAGMNGTVTGAGAAVNTGTAGNLGLGVVLTAQSTVTGLTKAVIGPDPWSGGADIQSDQALRDSVVRFLDSLSKATRPAIVYGCIQNGYSNVYVSEPGSGRVMVYCDDGGPVSVAKLATCEADLQENWKAAGARLTVSGPVSFPVAIEAQAYTNGSVSMATLRAGIQSAWASLFASKPMGSGLTRLELIAAAATVPGYDGINLYSPSANLTVKTATDEYNSVFGVGDLLPYQRPTLGAVTWR